MKICAATIQSETRCMDAAQRLALIRSRCRSHTDAAPKPKGIHAAATGMPSAVRKNGPWITTSQGVPGCNYGVLLYSPERRKKWVQESEEMPRREWQPKPRRGIHALTKIADRWYPEKIKQLQEPN
jgi:hypothetical protein